MSYINNEKFSKAVNIIYTNITEPIQLETIAQKAGLSLASLKRLFREAVGVSPASFIQRLRMEIAFCSLQSREASVLEVALAAGFNNHSAFTRQFKKLFGYSPSHARDKINIIRELDCIELEEPDIVDLTDISIQTVTDTGSYFEAAPKAWKNLQSKLNEFELSDDFAGVFIGISHDNPHDGKVQENNVRFSAGLSYLERNIGVEKRIINGGKYARFRYCGKPNNLGLAYHYIYGQWIEKNESAINEDIPPFIIFDDLPDGLTEQRIMVHVPLRSMLC